MPEMPEMPEIVWSGSEKTGNAPENFQPRFFLNLAKTSPASPASPASVAELAVVLARGFLRLTEKAPNSGIYRRVEPQKELDISRPESPHCGHET